MYVRLRFALLVLVAFLATPSSGAAQQRNAQLVPAAGPRIDAIVTGYRTTEQRLDNAVSLQRRQSQSQPVALMIVGGAAIVLGALIGGDIGLLFMIGGAVALLIGLYRYLQ